jgi:hypothetical protein
MDAERATDEIEDQEQTIGILSILRRRGSTGHLTSFSHLAK